MTDPSQRRCVICNPTGFCILGLHTNVIIFMLCFITNWCFLTFNFSFCPFFATCHVSFIHFFFIWTQFGWMHAFACTGVNCCFKCGIEINSDLFGNPKYCCILFTLINIHPCVQVYLYLPSLELRLNVCMIHKHRLKGLSSTYFYSCFITLVCLLDSLCIKKQQRFYHLKFGFKSLFSV